MVEAVVSYGNVPVVARVAHETNSHQTTPKNESVACTNSNQLPSRPNSNQSVFIEDILDSRNKPNTTPPHPYTNKNWSLLVIDT